MAVLYLDSFGHYATAQIGRKWHTGGSPTIVTGSLAPNFQALQFGTVNDVVWQVLANQTTLTVGFRMKTAALPAGSNNVLCWFGNGGSNQGGLTLSNTGVVSYRSGNNSGTILGSSAAGAITAGAFHYVELKVFFSGISGTVDVHVDGTSVISLVSQNTDPLVAGHANTPIWGQTNSGSGGWITWAISDLYITSSPTVHNSGILGPLTVEATYPDGSGAETQWQKGGSSPAATNWQSVSEHPPDDNTAYVWSGTPGNSDTYAIGVLSVSGVAIVAVQTVHCAEIATAGVSKIQPIVRVSGVDYLGFLWTVTGAYTFLPSQYDTDPSTSLAWAVPPASYEWGTYLNS